MPKKILSSFWFHKFSLSTALFRLCFIGILFFIFLKIFISSSYVQNAFWQQISFLINESIVEFSAKKTRTSGLTLIRMDDVSITWPTKNSEQINTQTFSTVQIKYSLNFWTNKLKSEFLFIGQNQERILLTRKSELLYSFFSEIFLTKQSNPNIAWELQARNISLKQIIRFFFREKSNIFHTPSAKVSGHFYFQQPPLFAGVPYDGNGHFTVELAKEIFDMSLEAQSGKHSIYIKNKKDIFSAYIQFHLPDKNIAEPFLSIKSIFKLHGIDKETPCTSGTLFEISGFISALKCRPL